MKKYLLVAMSALALGACSTPDVFNENGSNGYNNNPLSVSDKNMLHATHKAADRLVEQAIYLRNEHRPILITSIADITNVETTSAFGLMVSEQIGDRLVQLDFPIIDLRTRRDVAVRRKSGEFMLSRDIQKISEKHAAVAVLLGTYTAAVNHVYVSTRLVRTSDSRILAGYDFDFPMGPDIRKMARKRVR